MLFYKKMELKGEVQSIIFRSEDTGYTVLDIKVEDSVFTVVGNFPPISVGQNIAVEGKFQNKTAYGTQFFAENVYVSAPSRLEGIRRFLGSGLIHGLGPATADAIVETYGVESLEKMSRPMELAKVRGISLKRATEFGMSYIKLIKMQDSIVFLQGLGISMNLALKIYRVYEEKSEEIVRRNPYILIEDIEGIGFIMADRIAAELGIAKDSSFRICAALTYCLKEAANRNGHTYLPKDELLTVASQILKLDSEVEHLIVDNMNDMILLGDLISYDTDEHTAIVLKQNYYIERNIANKLLKIQTCAADLRVDVLDEVSRFEKSAGFTLHEGQIAAVKAAVENGVQIVTGGPGTGKTTIIKCILHLFMNLGKKVALCAPTGRAAKRLAEATGMKAKTIHRLLGMDFKKGFGSFTYDEYNNLPFNTIIVDEVSMVDEFVFNSLLKAVSNGTRLVLVGDKDQLASVGMGNVLGDLIACGKFPISYLTQIYRQSEDSQIVPNAHKINHGEMPVLDNKSSDFFFEERDSASQIANTAKELVTVRLPKYLGVTPSSIQVLCPMKRGAAGVLNLNRELQQVLNPPSKMKKEFKSGESIFREGDKVMQTQNDYRREWTALDGFKVEKGLGVYNGDVGIIESINSHIMQFTVRFDDDKTAIYQYTDADSLTLAYAVTIHKSQGCEFDTVVIALDANFMLQTRNLLYTAVTRAKKMVVIVGAKQTVWRMLKNNETARRYSLLVSLINDEYRGVL